MFVPTLDWGNELWDIAAVDRQGWAIAAVCHVGRPCPDRAVHHLGQAVLARHRRLLHRPDSLKVWLWLGVLLLSVIAGVRLDVLFSYQGNDMMTSFQVIAAGIANGDEAVKVSGKDGFYFSMLVFCIMAVLHVARIMLDLFMVQRFMLAWRAWLTDRLTGDWLDGKAYYRARFIDDTIDNPDQRIQADIDIFTAGNGPLPNTPNNTTSCHAAVRRGLGDRLDDFVHRDPVEPLGPADGAVLGIELPRAMFVIGIGLRRHRDDHRVLDRQADHLAVVQQREVQRRVPLRAGAAARRVGGGGLLPRRDRRAHRAAAALRARRRQLQAVRQPDGRVLRLEPLDQPDHRPAAISAAVPSVLLRRDHPRRDDPDRVGVRQHSGRAFVLPQRLRPVRRLPGRDHPSARPRGRQRRGQGAAGNDDRRRASTARSSSTMSRSAHPTASS